MKRLLRMTMLSGLVMSSSLLMAWGCGGGGSENSGVYHGGGSQKGRTYYGDSSQGTTSPNPGTNNNANTNANPNQNNNANTNTNNQPQPPAVNPWEDPLKDNLSTFAIDVDTASYSYVRRQLQSGYRPSASSVRVEEFVNYFDYKYEGPKDSPFKLYVDGAVSPFHKENHILRVGIQGRRMKASERPNMHLTFLIDTSCSMRGADRLSLVKESLKILLNQMGDGDTVAIATYAGSTRKVLEPTSANQKSTIISALDGLNAGGGTAMGSGMILAYEMASKSFVKGHENRVIVLSDGDANIGRTSHNDILKTIESYVEKGITMTTVGYGIGNYRDNRMEQLANKGNGNNFYIDSIEQARRVFEKDFISTMLTIAKDVKIQVEFNSDYVSRYRLVGYENRNIADKDFRNDKVDAGELGAGHTVTAIYEVQLHKDKVMPLVQSKSNEALVTVRLRFKGPDAKKEDKAAEIETPVPGVNLYRPLHTTSWQMQWATAVMAFAEVLRSSPHAKTWTFDQILAVAKAAKQANDDSHDEFLKLVEKAKSLK